MKIIIGADHGGFDFKQKLIKDLEVLGHEVVDVGAKEKSPDDDFVDYALEVVEGMGRGVDALGVLLCRNGVGMDIMANRFGFVRSALGFDEEQIKRARLDDDINCLALPADYLDYEKVLSLVKVFIETEFSGEEKYVRRLNKMAMIFGGGSGCCGGGGEGCACGH